VPEREYRRATDAVIRACYVAGDDLDRFRTRFLAALKQALPHDAAFFAAADPDTLLFTSAVAEDPLAAAGPLFLTNEFGAWRDVNRFADLVRQTDPVATLDAVTGGERDTSPRSREIMTPLGLGDELRSALRAGATAWGFLCLHRRGPSSFGPDDLAVARTVGPHAAAAVRRLAAAGGGPGVPASAVVLVAGGLVTAVAGTVDDLDLGPAVVGNPPPLVLAALVARLEAVERAGPDEDVPPAVLRTTTRGGALVTIHAARLQGTDGPGPVVVTVGAAAPHDRSSLLLAAHGLTPAQRRVTQLVLQGRTTAQIVVELRISAHTVQDHLKAVFDKVGVRSRRELVGFLMAPRPTR
jgi:DNA-binding CsgD family transcriptional regulator